MARLISDTGHTPGGSSLDRLCRSNTWAGRQKRRFAAAARGSFARKAILVTGRAGLGPVPFTSQLQGLPASSQGQSKSTLGHTTPTPCTGHRREEESL